MGPVQTPDKRLRWNALEPEEAVDAWIEWVITKPDPVIMPDEAIGDLRAWAARCRIMARIASTEAAASGFLRLATRFEDLWWR
jgi:hypothetical protein